MELFNTKTKRQKQQKELEVLISTQYSTFLQFRFNVYDINMGNDSHLFVSAGGNFNVNARSRTNEFSISSNETRSVKLGVP